MKYVFIFGAFILAGCAQAPTSDFDRIESFVKTIDSGLFFLREVDSGVLWGKAEKPIIKWDEKANSLCPTGYKTLLHSDEDLSYQGVSFSYMGGFVMATPATSNMPTVDGVVLCNSSPILEEDAVQILVDEFYIAPEQT